jgi:tol-pal system protein YbgF
MFRQSLLPCACLAVVLGLGVWAGPARGQDRSAYERLDRLERDLNMLQRHVYRGAPAPVSAPGSGEGGAAVNAQIRMDRLEGQMRDLTGRVEEFMNQVEQVRHRLEQLSSDVEMRFTQAPPGAGALAAVAPPGRAGPAGAARSARPSFPAVPPGAAEEDPPQRPGGYGLGPPGPPSLAPPGGPNPGYGSLTPPGSSAPGSPAEMASAGRGPAGGALPSGSATEQYNHAFGLLKQANYPAAEAALKAFVEAHPKDQMAGNAQYWLGETFYTRGRYMEAATAFAEGYKRYPKSPKAPDGLLKLGMSLARANQKQNACVALAQLDHDFPRVAASVKERASAEKKKLGC